MSGQTVVYFTFLYFSITIFKGQDSKANTYRRAILFFEKFGHWHYIIITSQDVWIKIF